MPYLIDTFRFFNEKCVIFCVTRQISQSQVGNLRSDLESTRSSIDTINQFGYYGGTISGELVISGNLSQQAESSSINVVASPFLFNSDSKVFSINNLTPKSGQVWIDGESGNAEIYLDSTGDCEIKFQTYFSTGDVTLSSTPNDQTYSLKINSSFGHEYLVEGKRSLAVFGKRVRAVNALEIGSPNGFRIESDIKNLDYGREVIDSVSVTDYCGVLYDFHISDWNRQQQQSLLVSWPSIATTFSSGAINQAGDSFSPMSGDIDAGKFTLYGKDEPINVSFTKKMIKTLA